MVMLSCSSLALHLCTADHLPICHCLRAPSKGTHFQLQESLSKWLLNANFRQKSVCSFRIFHPFHFSPVLLFSTGWVLMYAVIFESVLQKQERTGFCLPESFRSGGTQTFSLKKHPFWGGISCKKMWHLYLTQTCFAGFCFTPVVTSVWLQCEECMCLNLNVVNNLSIDLLISTKSLLTLLQRL